MIVVTRRRNKFLDNKFPSSQHGIMENIHPLKSYRHRVGVTLEALAKQVGVTKATLSRIENRRHQPRFKLAARIKRATKGAVTPNDFLSEPEREAS